MTGLLLNPQVLFQGVHLALYLHFTLNVVGAVVANEFMIIHLQYVLITTILFVFMILILPSRVLAQLSRPIEGILLPIILKFNQFGLIVSSPLVTLWCKNIQFHQTLINSECSLSEAHLAIIAIQLPHSRRS